MKRKIIFEHNFLHTKLSKTFKTFREGLTRKKKKKCEISHLGGGQDKIGSFSHFFIFFFYVLNHANLQRKFFLVWGEGTPLPESQNFLDILGKNLVIFYKFSRFISEKINSFYQNMFQLRERFNKKMISLGSNACLRSKTYPPTHPPPGGV